MPEFAYMIDVQWVKDNSPIDDNVDPKLLRNAMRTSQDVYIRDLIGSGLYDEILTQINASTLSANNQTLINQYIAPCLLHYIIGVCAICDLLLSPPGTGGSDAKALISFSVIVSSTLVATKGDRLFKASLVLEVSPSSSTIASLII